MNLLIFLAIGGVAGVLASLIMKTKTKGIVKNVVLGIIGAFVGGFVFDLIGVATAGLIGSLVTATFGAVLVIYIAEFIKK